ncbi:MAG: hypothetical protein AAB426_05190 [Myxococcota bacterium]
MSVLDSSEVYYRYTASDGSIVIVNDLNAVPKSARSRVTRTDLPSDALVPVTKGDGGGTFSVIPGPDHKTSQASSPLTSVSWALGGLAVGSALLLALLWALLRRKRGSVLVLLGLIVALVVGGGTYLAGQRGGLGALLPHLTLPVPATPVAPTGLGEIPQGPAAATQALQNKQAILDAIEASEQNSKR